MTTAERLREHVKERWGIGGALANQAADELEALTKERDDLKAKLAQVEADAAADRVRAALPLGSGQRLLDELATLRDSDQRRKGLLQRNQWHGHPYSQICPECCGNPLSGHKPTCPLAQELNEGK